MLQTTSSLKGYSVIARDGKLGSFSDLLFDDETWLVRWLVVDTGDWVTSLILPSAIGRPISQMRELAVDLTLAAVRGGPNSLQDEPVSRQMENHLYDYYGWSSSVVHPGAIASPLSSPPLFGATEVDKVAGMELPLSHQDPHLRSITAVTGYRIEATDGDIGHVKNFLVDNLTWCVRYLLIDTHTWFGGTRVVVATHNVSDIRWSDRCVRLDLSRSDINASPLWNQSRPSILEAGATSMQAPRL